MAEKKDKTMSGLVAVGHVTFENVAYGPGEKKTNLPAVPEAVGKSLLAAKVVVKGGGDAGG